MNGGGTYMRLEGSCFRWGSLSMMIERGAGNEVER